MKIVFHVVGDTDAIQYLRALLQDYRHFLETGNLYTQSMITGGVRTWNDQKIWIGDRDMAIDDPRLFIRIGYSNYVFDGVTFSWELDDARQDYTYMFDGVKNRYKDNNLWLQIGTVTAGILSTLRQFQVYSNSDHLEGESALNEKLLSIRTDETVISLAKNNKLDELFKMTELNCLVDLALLTNAALHERGRVWGIDLKTCDAACFSRVYEDLRNVLTAR